MLTPGNYHPTSCNAIRPERTKCREGSKHGFETRLLPRSLAATRRGFTFYAWHAVALAKAGRRSLCSIHESSLIFIQVESNRELNSCEFVKMVSGVATPSGKPRIAKMLKSYYAVIYEDLDGEIARSSFL